MDTQAKSSLSGLSGTLSVSVETATPPDGSTTPDDGTQEGPTSTATPMPSATFMPTDIATPTPSAVPAPLVTVSYAEIFPGGSEMSRNRPLDFAVKADFSSTVGTMSLLSGFLTYQGQNPPIEATCGQIPAESQARLTWGPEPSLREQGGYSIADWGHLHAEYIPTDATHFTAMFTISRQADAIVEYCIQKTYVLIDEPGIPTPADDPSAIKVIGITFWPDASTVDRSSDFNFGARLDFESIIMTQVRMLVFYIKQGQEIPGESTCMSGLVPEQSEGTHFNTGSATRMWTGISRFERAYTYSASAPDDATHLVMWLLLEGMSGQPILCRQKVIELFPTGQ
ncbi:MAG: hypothetical protein JXB07_06290 [Anaerolineae bacterium]|nr:hypothetical protein [Anaerolineae bacterium]